MGWAICYASGVNKSLPNDSGSCTKKSLSVINTAPTGFSIVRILAKRGHGDDGHRHRRGD